MYTGIHSYLFWFAFSCYDKTLPKSKMGKAVYSLFNFHITVHHWRNQGRNSKQESGSRHWSRDHEGMLLIGLDFMACSVCSFIQPKPRVYVLSNLILRFLSRPVWLYCILYKEFFQGPFSAKFTVSWILKNLFTMERDCMNLYWVNFFNFLPISSKLAH